MSDICDHYQSLLKLLLPTSIFDYFEITNLVVTDRTVSIYLNERNIRQLLIPIRNSLQY